MAVGAMNARLLRGYLQWFRHRGLSSKLRNPGCVSVGVEEWSQWLATCARSRAARRASRDRFPAGGSQEVFLIAFAVMTVVTMFHAKAAKISTQNARRPFQANGPVLKQYTTRSGVSSRQHHT